MIAEIIDINNTNQLREKINYSEFKVTNDKASILIENIFSTDNSKTETFLDTIELNRNVRTNIASEIVISFSPNEQVSDEKFKNIIQDYLKQMKYDNHPFIAYKHNDTKLLHAHIIISKISFNGIKKKQFNDFYKSQKISRDLEKKYNLKVTEYYYNTEKENLLSINARKFQFQSALLKGLKSYKTKSFLNKILSTEEIDKIQKKDFTNEQLSILLNNRKDDVFEYLMKNEMFNKIFKYELFERVNKCYEKCNSPKDFFERLKADNIYIRKVRSKTGEEFFLYGDKERNFYIEDKKLGKKFMYSSLCKTENTIEKENLKEFSEKEQKSYIKNIIQKSLVNTKNLKELSEKLIDKNIELITYQNSGGIYGIAYKSINIANSILIKGSDINYQYSVINKILTDNVNKLDSNIEDINYYNQIENNQNFEITQYLPFLPNLKNKNDNEDEMIRRKYKNKKNNNLRK